MNPPEETTYRDPVVVAYLRDVDRTLLRENLKLDHQERAAKHQRVFQAVDELRRAGEAARQRQRAAR